ncbi:MAG TPA: DUF4856 domain-containing protein, partial [Balneolaceae bacterium]|nr:DUF4856 domain-containing protein [Balneolaceae bacterium]
MKISKLFALAFTVLFMISCDSSDKTEIDVPSTYEFTRNSESTVSFTGQTTRILMASEL